MHDVEESRDEGAGRGRRGLKPCRVCGALHWQVFEKTPGSGDWYSRIWDPVRRKVFRKKIGPHRLALKEAAKWKGRVAENRFDPQAVAPHDEPLTSALKAYLDRRTDLNGDWHRIGAWWQAQPEVKRATVRDFAMDLDAVEAVKKRRLAAGIKPSTWNHDASFLHSFYEEYESRRRRNRKHAQTPPIPNPLKGMRLSEKEDERDRWLTEKEEARLRAQLPGNAAPKLTHSPA